MARSKYLWLIIGFAISIAIFATIVILAELQKPVGSKHFIPTEYVPYFVNFLPGSLHGIDLPLWNPNWIGPPLPRGWRAYGNGSDEGAPPRTPQGKIWHQSLRP